MAWGKPYEKTEVMINREIQLRIDLIVIIKKFGVGLAIFIPLVSVCCLKFLVDLLK